MRRTSSSCCPPPRGSGPRRARPSRRRRRSRSSGPRSTRSPGCSSTSRWPTSTDRSTTPSPRRWREDAQPGVRVKVRFAGQDVDGFVIERAATTEHTGRLQPLRRVVSPERVLTPDVAALTARRRRALRRHPLRRAAARRPAAARDRREGDVRAGAADHTRRPTQDWLEHYPGGPALLEGLAAGESPRAVWTVAARRRLGRDPGRGRRRHRAASGRGALVVRARPPRPRLGSTRR